MKKLLALLLFTGLAYAGEFDDYCVVCLANHVVHKTACIYNTEYDGKTYCFKSDEQIPDFIADPDGIIKRAQEFYDKNPGIHEKK